MEIAGQQVAAGNPAAAQAALERAQFNNFGTAAAATQPATQPAAAAAAPQPAAATQPTAENQAQAQAAAEAQLQNELAGINMNVGAHPTTTDVLTQFTKAMQDPTIHKATVERLYDFQKQLFEMHKQTIDTIIKMQ